MEHKSIGLSDEVFDKLKDLIYDISGIYFGIQKKYVLETRLVKRLAALNLPNYEDYYNYLKYSPQKNTEIKELLNSVTTNETSFFRDMPQLEVLVTVIKQLIEEGGKEPGKKIRIWSSACSTGEEPYSIGILLKENFSFTRVKFEIVGSDISNLVLNSAIEGLYGSYTLRNASPTILSKYFQKIDKDSYRINAEVKELTSFRNINLMDRAAVKSLGFFDVVLCRNVVIYFDMDSKKKAISNIYESLKPQGYLFMGHSESLHSITSSFKLVGIAKTPLYRKV